MFRFQFSAADIVCEYRLLICADGMQHYVFVAELESSGHLRLPGPPLEGLRYAELEDGRCYVYCGRLTRSQSRLGREPRGSLAIVSHIVDPGPEGPDDARGRAGPQSERERS